MPKLLEFPLVSSKSFDSMLSYFGSAKNPGSLRRRLCKKKQIAFGQWLAYPRKGKLPVLPSVAALQALTHEFGYENIWEQLIDKELFRIPQTDLFIELIKQFRKVLPELPFDEKTALWAEYFAQIEDRIIEANAKSIDKLLTRITKKEKSYKRTFARIVHDGIEGESDTLIVVGEPGTDKRRMIEFPTDLLRLNGIKGNGTAFILHEFNRPGHMKLQWPFPALQVLTPAEKATMKRIRRRAEKLPDVQ